VPEHTTTTTQKRLRILGDDEIAALYERPHFTDDERLEYCALSPREQATLAQLHAIKSRISCIVQLGYCKSHHRFCMFDLPDVAEDARSIQGHYFPEFPLTDLAMAQGTRVRQHDLILELCNYRRCDATQRRALTEHARQAATVSTKPLYIFRALMHSLTEHRIMLPGYTLLQDTVGQARTHEQERLTTLLAHSLSPADVTNLHCLLDEAPGRSSLPQRKREPSDCSGSEIKREIQRGESLTVWYTLAQKLLSACKISNESIKYYASLGSYYSVFRLPQLPERVVQISLLCFVYHRYQQLHENVINSVLYHIRQYQEGAKAAAKERVYLLRTEGNEDVKKAAQVLKLLTDAGIDHQTPFQEVQARAFSILPAPKIHGVAAHLTKAMTFDETALQWEHIDTLAPQLKRHVRPILQHVVWTASTAQASLMDAVQFLQDAWAKKRPLSQYPAGTLPRRFIPETARRSLYTPSAGRHRQWLGDR
jgi:hypothetical protein